MYLLAYRNLGIFYENAVNKMLHEIVEATKPEWCVVKGEFTPRGGLNTSIFARWPERRGGAGGEKKGNSRGSALELGGGKRKERERKKLKLPHTLKFYFAFFFEKKKKKE